MRSPAASRAITACAASLSLCWCSASSWAAGRVDAIGPQQALRVARVLAGDRVDQLQHVQGAQRDVREVADRRRDHVQGRLRIMLRTRGLARGEQGGAERSGSDGSQWLISRTRRRGGHRCRRPKQRGDAAEDAALERTCRRPASGWSRAIIDNPRPRRRRDRPDHARSARRHAGLRRGPRARQRPPMAAPAPASRG